jgi:hypothetical protein
MKSLPGSQPLLGEIPPGLVTRILGRSFDVTPCILLCGPAPCDGGTTTLISKRQQGKAVSL